MRPSRVCFVHQARVHRAPGAACVDARAFFELQLELRNRAHCLIRGRSLVQRAVAISEQDAHRRSVDAESLDLALRDMAFKGWTLEAAA